jgi:hypothetical protein
MAFFASGTHSLRFTRHREVRMRRTFALVAGALQLSGCTPNNLISFLYPKCKQERTSCADESRNPNPPWITDTSHWSGHFPETPPMGDTAIVPRVGDTTITQDSARR